MNKMLCLLITICAAGSALAVVVPDSNVFFDAQPPSLYDHSLTVYQDLGGDYTSMWFDVTWDAPQRTLTLSSQTANFDEGADFYLAPFNAAFSAETIARESFTPWFVLVTPYTLTFSNVVGPRTFFLGINTGVGFLSPVPNSPPRRDVFGWARMEFLPATATLRLVDNAMAYGEAGIVIGRDIAVVPEPSTVVLSIASVLTIIWRRQRHVC